MRKFVFSLMAIVAVLSLSSCEQQFDDFLSVKYDGKELSGVWACTVDTIYGDEMYYTEVVDVMIIDGYKMHKCKINNKGFYTSCYFDKGTLYNTTYDNLEIIDSWNFFFRDNQLILEDNVTGYYIPYAKLIIKGNTLKMVDVENGEVKHIFEKVKRFDPTKQFD
ncbi:MAG: hypothetical protein IKB24_01365 [Alistipes sp.]|nr:hypothetical protein [Alistipes sp.]